MSSSYDDETTLLVVTAAPKNKEEDTTRTNTILPSTAFKCLAAILGMNKFGMISNVRKTRRIQRMLVLH